MDACGPLRDVLRVSYDVSSSATPASANHSSDDSRASAIRTRRGSADAYLGRVLAVGDADRLTPTGAETAVVVADGLSATAVARHAVPLLNALLPRLGGRLAPIVAAHHARVALGDAIGAALAADILVMLIGERPGLSAPDSLGAYVTWNPRPGRVDSERNCVSNIRPPQGLDYETAAHRIAWLVHEAKARRLTGLALKDESAFATRLGQDHAPRKTLPVVERRLPPDSRR